MMLHESGLQPVYYYPDPLPDAPPLLKGLIAFYFDRVDRWLEEGEEIGVHPRDPYHRIDGMRTDRHVRISLDGEVLASDRAIALFESNLPPRWYIPQEDVVAELEPSDTVTRCPYKGTGGYYSVGDSKDLVWYYAARSVKFFANRSADVVRLRDFERRPGDRGRITEGA